MEFRDVIRDVSITTAPFAFENLVVSREDRGDGERVWIESYTTDREVVMSAYVKEDVPCIQGKFGLGNLGMLQGLLGLKTFQTESTKIEPHTKNDKIDGLIFKSDDAETRFVTVAEKLLPRQPKIAGIEYDAVVAPSASKSAELKSLSGVFKSVSDKIQPYVENNQLCFKLGGSQNNHSAVLQFSMCDGELSPQYSYTIDRVLQTLTRINNSTIEYGFSSRGMLVVTIDTGVVVYKIYITGGVS